MASSPPAGKKAIQVTPNDSLKQRMSVDKDIVAELLLVCGVIGTAVDGDTIVPVTDCLNWLQDLQRALRRDDDLYRPISLLVGQWKVVQQKLLPLVATCRYDTAIVLTICKILVILTKPLAENTLRAGRMVLDTKKYKDVLKEQILLRENALQQSNHRMELVRAIVHFPSKDGEGILSIFVSLLAEPLSKTGTARTDADHLTIELVLHLFCNLLSAEPLLIPSTESAQAAQQLHDELICLLERELVLEILLVLGADLEARENAPYNLLVMELLHQLLRQYDPTAVGKIGTSLTGSRKPLLSRDKQPLAPTRHGHFGGTLIVAKHGRKQPFSAMRLGQLRPDTAPKRKNKKSEPFIGGKKHAFYSPSHNKALQVIDSFCVRFLRDCYGPVMKSLKNEFRRDSVRLEDGDRVVFFRIVWFFIQWWRVAGKSKVNEKGDAKLGQLIFSMDLFSFKMVLNGMDTFEQHKKYTRLAQAVALYSEMLHLLHIMHISKDETEAVMALGLMDRLFYNSEPLDRLPRLLSKWQPGTTTREYLADLAEVVHMTLKLLETIGSNVEVAQNKDTIQKMKAAAGNFDVAQYLSRRIISNHTVLLYTHLLSQYGTNSKATNHRIISMLLRLRKHVIASPDSNDQSLLATKVVTLEPMLFCVQLLVLLAKILNDLVIRNDEDFSFVLSFATSLVQSFAASARENPMLFVEALFKHPSPQRFCDQVSNMYITDELRMIAERELLLEEQKRLDEEEAAAAAPDEDSEEELEFEDYGMAAAAAPKANLHVSRPLQKRVIDDSDDDDSRTSGKGPEKPSSLSTTKLIDDVDDDSSESLASTEKLTETLKTDNDSDDDERGTDNNDNRSVGNEAAVEKAKGIIGNDADDVDGTRKGSNFGNDGVEIDGTNEKGNTKHQENLAAMTKAIRNSDDDDGNDRRDDVVCSTKGAETTFLLNEADDAFERNHEESTNSGLIENADKGDVRLKRSLVFHDGDQEITEEGRHDCPYPPKKRRLSDGDDASDSFS